MAQNNFSSKRIQIDKANVTIVIVVSIACFVTIFSLVASKAMLQQRSYQAKVISMKTTARDQLKSNIAARNALVAQYKVFEAKDPNIIGGPVNDWGNDRAGDNATIVLDALPSKYDYPALTASLEKLLNDSGLTINDISGIDDSLNNSSDSGTATPQPVEMPYQVGFSGPSDRTQNFLNLLDASIRPMHVQTITVTGNDAQLSTTITAKTYYQPEKTMNIKSEVVN